MQIAGLQQLGSERDIRKRLGKLPKPLKTTYDELYNKINSQKESAPMIANRAFQWVMCSCRPLSPAELVAAVCQDPDTDEVDKISINIDFVLDACQNLLVVDQELKVCRFSHFSVQEYLETHHWSSCEPDCLAGKVCLSLLINNSATSKQNTRPTDKGSTAHDLLEYARCYGATHVRRLEGKGIVDSRLNTLRERFPGPMEQRV